MSKMMMINSFTEILSKEEKRALVEIQKAIDFRFSNLVRISGLRPEFDFKNIDLAGMDFRGEDLRGFDFSGSDLRGCIRDEDTIIDESTILKDCAIDWVESDDPQITEMMAKIQETKDLNGKSTLLKSLSADYFSPDHVRRFLRGQIERSGSMQEFFLLTDHFNAKTVEDRQAVLKGLKSLALKRVSKPKRRNRNPSPIRFSDFLHEVQNAKNPFIESVFSEFLKKTISPRRISIDPTAYEVSDDLIRFIEAIERTEALDFGQLFQD